MGTEEYYGISYNISAADRPGGIISRGENWSVDESFRREGIVNRCPVACVYPQQDEPFFVKRWE